MPIPKHIAKIYQKPALGTNYLTSFPIYNYRHSINAIGGFDTASCDILIRTVADGQQFIDQYLANRVSFIVDNPVEPIWEGYINRISFSAGGVEYSISLDEMANRVRAVYCAANGNTGVTQGAVVSSTASQTIFGIKQEQIDLGLMQAGTGATIIRDTVLAQRAFPKTSILPSGGGSGLLHIECLGFFHTLEWEDFRQTTSANVQLGNFLDTIIGGIVNGATFFDNTDLTQTAANTNVIDQTTAKGETVWEILQKIQEFGDTSSHFVMGVSPTLFGTGTRRFYYRAASTTVVYTALRADGLRIRNLHGGLIDPWRVRPDAGIRISDNLIAWNGVGDNPTETYIMKIDYDANKQSCIYAGDDDLSAEGVFNLKRRNKAQGKRFGEVRRVA